MLFLKYTFTAGRVFSSGGERGILPPLTAVFPPFRLAVIIVYYVFQKIIHPQDPLPPASTPIFPPFKISLENTLPVIDLSKPLQKAYQAKALSKRSRMTFVSAL